MIMIYPRIWLLNSHEPSVNNGYNSMYMMDIVLYRVDDIVDALDSIAYHH